MADSERMSEEVRRLRAVGVDPLFMNRPEDTHYNSPYLKKIVKAGNFKAYAKAHRQQLVAMFARSFRRVPAEIVPLIVDYGFHIGFY